MVWTENLNDDALECGESLVDAKHLIVNCVNTKFRNEGPHLDLVIAVETFE